MSLRFKAILRLLRRGLMWVLIAYWVIFVSPVPQVRVRSLDANLGASAPAAAGTIPVNEHLIDLENPGRKTQRKTQDGKPRDGRDVYHYPIELIVRRPNVSLASLKEIFQLGVVL